MQYAQNDGGQPVNVITHGLAFTHPSSGVQFPSNFLNSASAAELKAIGYHPMIDKGPARGDAFHVVTTPDWNFDGSAFKRLSKLTRKKAPRVKELALQMQQSAIKSAKSLAESQRSVLLDGPHPTKQSIYLLKQEEVVRHRKSLGNEGAYPWAADRASVMGGTVAGVIEEWGTIMDDTLVAVRDIERKQDSAVKRIMALSLNENIQDAAETILGDVFNGH